MEGSGGGRAVIWKNVVQHVSSANKVIETERMWEERGRDQRLQKKIDEIDCRHGVALRERQKQLTAEISDLKRRLPCDVYYAPPLDAFKVSDRGDTHRSASKRHRGHHNFNPHQDCCDRGDDQQVSTTSERSVTHRQQHDVSRRHSKRRRLSSLSECSSDAAASEVGAARRRCSPSSPNTSRRRRTRRGEQYCADDDNDDIGADRDDGQSMSKTRRKSPSTRRGNSGSRKQSRANTTHSATKREADGRGVARSDDGRHGGGSGEVRCVELRSQNQWEAARIENAALKVAMLIKQNQDSNLKHKWKSDMYFEDAAVSNGPSPLRTKHKKKKHSQRRRKTVHHNHSVRGRDGTSSSSSSSRSNSSTSLSDTSTSSSSSTRRKRRRKSKRSRKRKPRKSEK